MPQLEGCYVRRPAASLAGVTLSARNGRGISFSEISTAGVFPQRIEGRGAANRASGADCLFIGMPTPHKERFLAAHRDIIKVPFIMGVGGGIDIIAQITKRAPVWMQRIGLEWLYRIMQEPRRMWKRCLTTNMVFAAIVAKAAFRRL